MPKTGSSKTGPTGLRRQIARENAVADRMARADAAEAQLAADKMERAKGIDRSIWSVKRFAGRVWWDHRTDDAVPRIRLKPDGTFFFTKLNGETKEFETLKSAAEAAIHDK